MTRTELRAARERLGLSREAVASAFGVSIRTYERWEYGEVAVSPLVTPEGAAMIRRLTEGERTPPEDAI